MTSDSFAADPPAVLLIQGAGELYFEDTTHTEDQAGLWQVWGFHHVEIAPLSCRWVMIYIDSDQPLQ